LSIDEEILKGMDQDYFMFFQMMVGACNFNDFFISHEMEERERWVIHGPNHWYLGHLGYNANHTPHYSKV
jgi:hypothetical protein